MRRRSTAVLLLVLGGIALLAGITGLVLGRMGETTWAPATEHVATATLDDPGPAVVIDPGILYAGGHEGTLTVTGPADVTVIPADPKDVTAYLGDARYTEITGVPDWSTLTATPQNPDGSEDLGDVVGADLWADATPGTSTTATVDVADRWAAENDPPQPYRALLVVTDGQQAGATTVSISWPTHLKNAWVPQAYLAGAIAAVIGLILLVLGLIALRRSRRADGAIDGAATTQDAPSDRPAGGRSASEAAAGAAGMAIGDGTARTPGSHRAPPLEEGDATEAPRHGRRRAVVVDEDSTGIHHPTVLAETEGEAAPAPESAPPAVADGPREDDTDVMAPIEGGTELTTDTTQRTEQEDQR